MNFLVAVSPAPLSRQSAKLFLQSSEMGLPQPLTRRRVCPPFSSGGRGTLAGERGGWESPNFDEGTYTVVLYLYVLCALHWSLYLFRQTGVIQNLKTISL
jgi:hypothetical protein